MTVGRQSFLISQDPPTLQLYLHFACCRNEMLLSGQIPNGNHPLDLRWLDVCGCNIFLSDSKEMKRRRKCTGCKLYNNNEGQRLLLCFFHSLSTWWSRADAAPVPPSSRWVLTEDSLSLYSSSRGRLPGSLSLTHTHTHAICLINSSCSSKRTDHFIHRKQSSRYVHLDLSLVYCCRLETTKTKNGSPLIVAHCVY